MCKRSWQKCVDRSNEVSLWGKTEYIRSLTSWWVCEKLDTLTVLAFFDYEMKCGSVSILLILLLFNPIKATDYSRFKTFFQCNRFFLFSHFEERFEAFRRMGTQNPSRFCERTRKANCGKNPIRFGRWPRFRNGRTRHWVDWSYEPNDGESRGNVCSK